MGEKIFEAEGLQRESKRRSMVILIWVLVATNVCLISLMMTEWFYLNTRMEGNAQAIREIERRLLAQIESGKK